MLRSFRSSVVAFYYRIEIWWWTRGLESDDYVTRDYSSRRLSELGYLVAALKEGPRDRIWSQASEDRTEEFSRQPRQETIVREEEPDEYRYTRSYPPPQQEKPMGYGTMYGHDYQQEVQYEDNDN